MPQQDACKHFFNSNKNIWRLHTFLHHFGNTRSFAATSASTDERLSQILITETSCSVKGHPRKARSLVRKWITYTKKNQHALNPTLEKSLLSCLVGKKEMAPKMEHVSHYHDHYIPLTFTNSKTGKFTSPMKILVDSHCEEECQQSTDVEEMSEDAYDKFQDSNDSLGSPPPLYISRTDKSESMPLSPASPPLAPVFPLALSPSESIIHLQSSVREIVEDLKKMEQARQELQKTLETKQKLLDRYESLSTMQSLHASMNSDPSPSFSSFSSLSAGGSPPFLYDKDFKFIGDIQTDSTLYLSNYRTDLHIFVLLYGVDSLRVSSLLDSAVQVFNAYATHFRRRSQLQPAFEQFRWYLLMNNFSLECQHVMAGDGEFRRLVEAFFNEVESVCI